MENKIQELTDKIYREGVEKGNEEARRLIANAQEEAKKIVNDAIKKVNTASKAAKTEVVEGDNMQVTETKGADGQSIYTVATKKDVNFDTVTVGNVKLGRVLISNQK